LRAILFFLNPFLFASCTNTFSKCCEITTGMKRSASTYYRTRGFVCHPTYSQMLSSKLNVRVVNWLLPI
jgi:hypothetical protein